VPPALDVVGVLRAAAPILALLWLRLRLYRWRGEWERDMERVGEGEGDKRCLRGGSGGANETARAGTSAEAATSDGAGAANGLVMSWVGVETVVSRLVTSGRDSGSRWKSW
jgi:hypothetical protein